jgi:hypothetical protein
VINPYIDEFGTPARSRCDPPAAGAYDIVFESPAGGSPGAFTFRFWVTTYPADRPAPNRAAEGRSACGSP